MKKVSVFHLYLLDKTKQKILALQLGTAWAQKSDSRNTKKEQNYTFAGEQQEGKKPTTTDSRPGAKSSLHRSEHTTNL